ncbi:GntR family transcriptional regulator [Pseudooceanicola aestuarii]|uniref:GntR family transcriptional regulator n=1 Tax=Pseudooceanicola aestuarii TaxID=2697319 RepID=UPI0013D245CE|nr:GntR family transcriptional regulator [Pseudooceanicola aestuarii]
MKKLTDAPAPAGPRLSLRDQAYDTLKRRILNCELRPGEAVTVAELAAALGIGRTPVTQAVDRLMLDGLVQVMPRKGVVVSPVSLNHLVEIIEIRLLNEVQAARWAARNASKGQIRHLRDNIRRMHKASATRDVAELITLDGAFHRLIAEAARNTILMELLGNLHDRSLRFWTLSLRVPHRNDRVCEQHEAIVDAIATGDPDRAEQALSDHITDFQANIIGQISRF